MLTYEDKTNLMYYVRREISEKDWDLELDARSGGQHLTQQHREAIERRIQYLEELMEKLKNA